MVPAFPRPVRARVHRVYQIGDVADVEVEAAGGRSPFVRRPLTLHGARSTGTTYCRGKGQCSIVLLVPRRIPPGNAWCRGQGRRSLTLLVPSGRFPPEGARCGGTG